MDAAQRFPCDSEGVKDFLRRNAQGESRCRDRGGYAFSLAGRYDTAVLVSGDEDFVYAVNAVAYKGCRVEVAGFRSNTAPRLIDVADFFIDLGDIAELVSKDASSADGYDIPSFIPPDEIAPPQKFVQTPREDLPTKPGKINFQTNFDEEEDTEDFSNLVRVRDDA